MTGAFVDLRGVRTWCDEAGDGPPLVCCIQAVCRHGFLVEKPDICSALLLECLTRDPVTTFAPMRRA